VCGEAAIKNKKSKRHVSLHYDQRAWGECLKGVKFVGVGTRGTFEDEVISQRGGGGGGDRFRNCEPLGLQKLQRGVGGDEEVR